MDREHLLQLVHGLNDVELAVLLCLVARRHCILTAAGTAAVEMLEVEIEIIAARAFGLLTATVRCTPETTLDELVGGLLVSEDSTAMRRIRSSLPAISPLLSPDPAEPYSRKRSDSRTTATATDPFAGSSSKKRIANVVILRGLEGAGLHIQAQVLELMRTRRVVTSRSVLEVPERFLVIALLPKTNSLPALLKHLRAQFFISHHHAAPEDDEAEDAVQSSADSFASVVVRKHPDTPSPILPFPFHPLGRTFIPPGIIDDIRALAGDVAISTEIRRYLLDIVVFLRMHRAVKDGVAAQATADFELLVKCIAPLHGFDFATPALVTLAVFKVYCHRIELVQRANDERSILWGSAPKAVEDYLRQVDVETVIEEVLADVKAPL